MTQCTAGGGVLSVGGLVSSRQVSWNPVYQPPPPECSAVFGALALTLTDRPPMHHHCTYASPLSGGGGLGLSYFNILPSR